jgi:cytochrome c oxidase subunit I
MNPLFADLRKWSSPWPGFLRTRLPLPPVIRNFVSMRFRRAFNHEKNDEPATAPQRFPQRVKRCLFSTDHKIIAVQYGITGFFFLAFGFALMILMRWQVAYPGAPVPIIGELLQGMFGPNAAPKGALSAQLFNSFGAMHGTIMIFLGVVPVLFGAFGNYLIPLQIGAPDMAFPRLNRTSYQLYVCAGIVMLASFFLPSGAAQSGWTSYAPLATFADPVHKWDGQTFWLIGMSLLIGSSLLGSINFLVTIIQLRAPGMIWMRLPLFVWAQFVTSFLLLLAFPPLQGAAVLQFMDGVFGTSFFLPSGLMASGKPLAVSGGGNPLLWQHLFWFLAHPEVYVLILPALGIESEILANNTRRPIFGYRSIVYASLAMGFVSFIVWGHHLFLTGMGTAISTFFQTTTMIVSIPSVIILTCLLFSLWRGSIRFNTQMLFALAFLPMFGLGGLTGLPLGLAPSDMYLHDTFYVIAHFHYIVAPGALFAFFAGVYHWFPKLTGRKLNEHWGRIHFWLSFLFMNLVFMPMFLQGLAGMSRRLYDGGVTYQSEPGVVGLPHWSIGLNSMIFSATLLLAFSQIPFVLNVIQTLRSKAARESDNPWQATTLEWQTSTPPPHGNFPTKAEVFRGPYEYSAATDGKFIPQSQR